MYNIDDTEYEIFKNILFLQDMSLENVQYSIYDGEVIFALQKSKLSNQTNYWRTFLLAWNIYKHFLTKARNL